MNKFPIHQLQANFYRICCCDFKSQSPRGSHEIVHAPEYRPRKQQSEGTDHQRLLHTDLNEIMFGIKLHQHLSPGKIKGLPNRFGTSGADGCIDGFNFSLPCNPHNQLTGVGCIVDTEIHRDTPSLGESMQQLINTKCEHEAADEAAFVVYGAFLPPSKKGTFSWGTALTGITSRWLLCPSRGSMWWPACTGAARSITARPSNAWAVTMACSSGQSHTSAPSCSPPLNGARFQRPSWCASSVLTRSFAAASSGLDW